MGGGGVGGVGGGGVKNILGHSAIPAYSIPCIGNVISFSFKKEIISYIMPYRIIECFPRF